MGKHVVVGRSFGLAHASLAVAVASFVNSEGFLAEDSDCRCQGVGRRPL